MDCALGPVRGGSAREHLVQNAAKGVDVRSAIEGAGGRGLLRAHVMWGAEREARLGQFLTACCVERLGDAEVRHQSMPTGEEDVLGLDVAVNDAPIMRVLQRIRHLPGEDDRLIHRELRLSIEPVA